MKALIGVVLLLAAVGGGYYLYSRNTSNVSTGSNQARITDDTQSENGTFKGTLNELVKRGGNYKCNWNFKEDMTYMKGTTYVSGNKFSGEATAKTNDVELVTHMVGNGSTVYSWASVAGITTGTKFSYNELDQDREITEEDKKNAEQAFKQLDYKCSGWTPDPTKFVVPTDINFVTVVN